MGGGDQRGRMHTNERSHVKLITIGVNGLYWRRKRSNLNPSTSVRCEGIVKNFFLHFFEETEIFHVILFSLFLAPHFGKIQVLFSEDIFFMYFFLHFWYRLCIFCNNLVFTICLYGNYIYVLFLQILTFLKLCLVFAKLLKN